MGRLLYTGICAISLCIANGKVYGAYSNPGSDCSAPVITNANAVSPASALIEWLDLWGQDENTYDLEVVLSGTPQTYTPTVSGIQGDSYIISGLDQGTLYDVYIRAHCPDDSSEWNGPARVATWIVNGEACLLDFPVADNTCPDYQEFPIQVDVDSGLVLGTDIFLQEIHVVVEHPWLADLTMTLESPSGASVVLSSDNGVGAQNFGNPEDSSCSQTLMFADFACTSITELENDFTGYVIPEEPLSTFLDGSPANGKWILRICDKASDDAGTLIHVFLDFGGDPCDIPPSLYVTSEQDSALTMQVVPAGQCSEIQLAYFQSTTGGTGDTVFVLEACDTVHVVLSGLIPNSEYIVLARSLCLNDTSVWSCPVPVSTSCHEVALYSDFDAGVNCETVCSEPCALTDTIWANVTGDNTDWIAHSGPTPTELTGPTSDRTGVGKFLYFESSGLSCGDTSLAVLKSRCLFIQEDTTCDMSFWYHMYGANTGILSLDISTDGGTAWTTLWSAEGDQGEAWHPVDIDLSAYTDQLVQLRFSAVRFAGFLSDIAIDDIAFYGALLPDSADLVYYLDEDGDMFGNPDSIYCICASQAPADFTADSTDCNDNDAGINPAAEEVPCNLIDDNCNGDVDEDQNQNPVAYTIVQEQDASCTGVHDGILELAVTSGMPPYAFLWTTGDTTPAISGLAPGEYAATITDANGCAAVTELFEITEVESLTYFLMAVETPSCPGIPDGSIEGALLGGQAPFSYQWSNGDSTLNPDSIDNGIYRLTVTDDNGCRLVTDSVLVDAEPVFQVSIIQLKHARCPGSMDGKIRLQTENAEEPVSFIWSNGDTTALADSLTAGMYSCTVTDAQGCVNILPAIAIDEPEPLSITIDALEPPICADDETGTIQITAGGGTPPYFYQWSNNVISDDLFNVIAGTYAVTITDFYNCQVTMDSIQLEAPPQLELAVDTIVHVNCPGSTDGQIQILVSGGTRPYTYNWSTGATDTSGIHNLPVGTYALTISDAFGCKSVIKDLRVVSLDSPLSFSEGSIEEIRCYGDSTGQISMAVETGTPPYFFNWSIGQEYLVTDTFHNISNLPAGSYNVTVTDARGCVGVSPNVTLSQPPPILFHLDSIVAVRCYGASDGAIWLTVSGGTPPYQHSWTSGEHTEDITELDAGSYRLEVMDSNGCQYQTPWLVVTQPDSVHINFTTKPSDNGASNGWAEVAVTGGTPPYAYTWDDNAGAQTTRRATDLSPGYYSITVTDRRECAYTDSVYVDLVNATQYPNSDVFRIYPNPANDAFYIPGLSGMRNIALWSVSGQRYVPEQEMVEEDVLKCSVSNMQSGLYMLEINGRITGKRVIILSP